MPSRESEALILRSYPYREADLIVSFFTRDQGKIRGIARRARRPKNPFGSGLERLAHVRLTYFQKETRELVQLDRCELMAPPLFLKADYASSVALDYVAEVSEKIQPEHEPSDAFFRLLVLVLGEIQAGLSSNNVGTAGAEATDSTARGNVRPAADAVAPGAIWRAVTYFSLWAVRLGGWLPPLDVCSRSGDPFAAGEPVYFDRSSPGFFGAAFRNGNSWRLSVGSRNLADRMLKASLTSFRGETWSKETAKDFRQFLTQRIEAQLESRLNSAAVLAEL